MSITRKYPRVMLDTDNLGSLMINNMSVIVGDEFHKWKTCFGVPMSGPQQIEWRCGCGYKILDPLPSDIPEICPNCKKGGFAPLKPPSECIRKDRKDGENDPDKDVKYIPLMFWFTRSMAHPFHLYDEKSNPFRKLGFNSEVLRSCWTCKECLNSIPISISSYICPHCRKNSSELP